FPYTTLFRSTDLVGVLDRDPAHFHRARCGRSIGDERAAEPAAPRFHVPGVLQRPDRLPQRDPADAKKLRQLALGGKPAPRPHYAQLDDREQFLDGFLERVLRPD